MSMTYEYEIYRSPRSRSTEEVAQIQQRQRGVTARPKIEKEVKIKGPRIMALPI